MTGYRQSAMTAFAHQGFCRTLNTLLFSDRTRRFKSYPAGTKQTDRLLGEASRDRSDPCARYDTSWTERSSRHRQSGFALPQVLLVHDERMGAASLPRCGGRTGWVVARCRSDWRLPTRRVGLHRLLQNRQRPARPPSLSLPKKGEGTPIATGRTLCVRYRHKLDRAIEPPNASPPGAALPFSAAQSTGSTRHRAADR